MVLDPFSDFAREAVTANIGTNDPETIDVNNAATFTDPSGSRGSYYAVIWDSNQGRPDQDGDAEIVEVTGWDTTNDTLTVARGKGSTTNTSHPSSSVVAENLVSLDLDAINTALEDLADYTASPTEVTAPVNNSSVTTGKLSGTWAEDIIAISGSGVVSSALPSSSTTPIQDAIDAINNDTGSGAIYLPDATINEEGPISGLSNISLIGKNVYNTVIKESTGSNSLIKITQQSDGQGVYLDNLELSGGDKSTRSGGHAIEWDASGSNFHSFNMGRISFNEWQSHCLLTNSSRPYSSHWGWLRMRSNNYDGQAISATNGLSNVTIGNLYVGNASGGSAPEIFTATGVTQLKIGIMNVGGSPGEAIQTGSGFSNGYISVGNLNYEPSGSTSVGSAVVCADTGRMDISHIRNHESGLFQVVQLKGGAGKVHIGEVTNIGNSVTPIAVVDDTGDYNTYSGPSGDVVNATGGTTLTHGVACLGDLTIVT